MKLSAKYDNGLDWMLGLSNNSGYSTLDTNPYALLPNAQNYDTDEEKAFLWRVGYEVSDSCRWPSTVSTAATARPRIRCRQRNRSSIAGGCGITIDSTGRSNTGNTDRQLLFDFTLNWDPSDRLSTWVNIDYMKPTNERRTSGSPYAVGIAAAGRYGITDNTGIALRGEYIYSNDNYLGIASPFNLATVAPDILDNGIPFREVLDQG